MASACDLPLSATATIAPSLFTPEISMCPPALAKPFDAIAPLRSVNWEDGFTFAVNGRAADLSLSGVVAQQLRVDSCALRFTVDCGEMSGRVFSFFEGVECGTASADFTFPGHFGIEGICHPAIERASLD
jgi:hypothetical protein